MNNLVRPPHHYSQQADCNETEMKCILHHHSGDSGYWDNLKPGENIMCAHAGLLLGRSLVFCQQLKVM